MKSSWKYGYLSVALVAHAAHAFNPFEGADPTPAHTLSPLPASRPTYSKPITPTFTPARNFPVAPAAPPPPPALAYTPPPPAPAAAPSYQAPPPAPPPMAYDNGYVPPPPMNDSRTAYDTDRFTFGLETYYDIYKEEIFDLDNRGVFGSIDAGWTHYYTPRWFSMLDGRVSYGRDDYDSVSGKASGISQYEYEARLSGGFDVDFGQGRHFKPYLGVGVRYFNDELKGTVTSLGAVGYDRRILQFYAPVGMTYEFPAWGLTAAPTVEFDPVLYGYVQSRLQNIGQEQFSNNQHDGYGWRADFMLGNVNERGYGWQAGPFLRYWLFDDSDPDQNASGTGIEPENSRLQVGAKFQLLF